MKHAGVQHKLFLFVLHFIDANRAIGGHDSDFADATQGSDVYDLEVGA